MYENNPEARSKDRRNEPKTIPTTTGARAAANSVGPGAAADVQLPPLSAADVWIDQGNQAKQGMARKSNLKGAQAAPNHPHLHHAPGSGETQ